jgi:hypothetical protein
VAVRWILARATAAGAASAAGSNHEKRVRSPEGPRRREGVFPGEKKTNRLWHISLRFFTFFPLNHEPKKSPDARSTARETETSHDATRTAPSLFSFVFVIGVFREDT